MTTREPWVIRQTPGGLAVDLSRLTDGRVACRLCLRYTPPDDLYRDGSGRPSDFCAPCKWLHSGIPNGICHCRCCIKLFYWRRHGRPKYTLADTCSCATFVDRAMACGCKPCLEHAPRPAMQRRSEHHEGLEEAGTSLPRKSPPQISSSAESLT